MKNTYVYFIAEHHSEAVRGGAKCMKIGMARDPESRVKELQTGNPRDLSIVLTLGPMSEKRAANVEKFLHRKFRRWYVRGEWFRKGALDQIGRITNVEFDGCVTIYPIRSGWHKGTIAKKLKKQLAAKAYSCRMAEDL